MSACVENVSLFEKFSLFEKCLSESGKPDF